MKPLRKLTTLQSDDRKRLVKAVILLGAIRIGLYLTSYKTLRGTLSRISKPSAEVEPLDYAATDSVLWAVKAASKRMPWASTCLTRGLAGQVMLGRMGKQTRLHIGVARDTENALKAHAWLEADGKVIIGADGDVSEFTQLVPHEIELK